MRRRQWITLIKFKIYPHLFGITCIGENEPLLVPDLERHVHLQSFGLLTEDIIADLALDQIAQHRMQDAAITIVIDLDWCIDAHNYLELSERAIIPGGLDRHLLTGL